VPVTLLLFVLFEPLADLVPDVVLVPELVVPELVVPEVTDDVGGTAVTVAACRDASKPTSRTTAERVLRIQ
jgi:hypothetical protein